MSRHAPLTVTVDKGDYVLDNQNDDILLWSETSYCCSNVSRSPTPTCGSRSAIRSWRSQRQHHAEMELRFVNTDEVAAPPGNRAGLCGSSCE
jgi:Bacterial transglutaminase-like cysteine proteinase BTLCP